MRVSIDHGRLTAIVSLGPFLECVRVGVRQCVDFGLQVRNRIDRRCQQRNRLIGGLQFLVGLSDGDERGLETFMYYLVLSFMENVERPLFRAPQLGLTLALLIVWLRRRDVGHYRLVRRDGRMLRGNANAPLRRDERRILAKGLCRGSRGVEL